MSANENQDGLTAQQRLEDWNSFCVKFYRHLTDRPGTILSAAWRLAIVVAAQEALDCKGCQSAGASTCLRPGSAFGFISSLDHQLVLQGLDDAPENAKTVVRNLVVTIVNHQTKVDEKWYDQTIDALDKHTHLIPSSIVGENRRGMLGTLFAEILGLTIVSHGIDLSYRAIERSPPPMPRIEDVQQLALEPTMWNIAKSLKKGKELRIEKQGAGWAPLLEYGDLDKSSIADMFAPDQINSLKKRMVAMLPFAVLNMSPHDLLIEYDYFDTFAYDQKDIMKTWVRLDPKQHCRGFSRYDKEIVATAVAETYNCGF